MRALQAVARIATLEENDTITPEKGPPEVEWPALGDGLEWRFFAFIFSQPVSTVATYRAGHHHKPVNRIR